MLTAETILDPKQRPKSSVKLEVPTMGPHTTQLEIQYHRARV